MKAVRSRTVLVSWFLSFLILLALPTVIFLAGHLRTERVLQEEIRRANLAVLHQARQALDAAMEDVRRLCFGISLNRNLQAVLYQQGAMDSSTRYRLWQIVDKDLNSYAAVTDPGRRFYVYVAAGDLVLQPGSYHRTETAYEDFHGGSSLGHEEWLRLLRATSPRTAVSIRSRTGGQEILYLQPIAGESGRPAGSVGVVLDETVVSRILDGVDWMPGAVLMILDAAGNVLLGGIGPERVELPDGVAEAARHGGTRVRVGGRDFLALSDRSSVMDWDCLSLVPMERLKATMRALRWFSVACILLDLLLGAVLSFSLAKRNYGPLRRLVEGLKDSSVPVPAEGNEYAFIEKAFHAAKAGNDEVRCALLRNVLHGTASDPLLVRRAFAEQGGQRLHPSYSVALFLPGAAAFPGQKAEAAAGRAAGLLSAAGHAVCVALDGQLACLVNHPTAAAEGIPSAADSCRLALERDWETTVTSANGSAVAAEGIARSYQEAQAALEYRLLLGAGRHIAHDPSRGRSRLHRFSLETERRLVNALMAGDLSEALGLLDGVFRDNLPRQDTADGPSLDLVKCLLFDLVNATGKALEGIDRTYRSDLRERLDPMKAVMRHDTMDAVRTALDGMFTGICAFVEERKRSHKPDLREAAERHVRESFGDVNLSNRTIAERLRVNPSYLSRYYKEQAGEGLSEFVARTRIDAAKRILTETDLPLGEVARRVGLSGDVALIKLFKRLEGITPGRFQKESGLRR